MENFIIEKEIKVYCKKASSFPDGVLAAHQTLHAMVSYHPGRKYFGLSRPEGNGSIQYWAGAEEYIAGEFEGKGLEEITVKKGNYISIRIDGFMSNIAAIGQAFQNILQQADIDPEGYCVEWYLNEHDVLCMVRTNA